MTGNRRRPTRETLVLVASDWAPIRAFDPLLRQDPEGAYGDLLPALRSADLRIVNCECALTSARKHVWKSGAVFKGAPEHVKGLTAVPFHVACLGNNHVLDFGVAGLGQTLALLERNGIRTVGAGLTEEQAYAPLTLKVNGTKLHIVNFSEGEDLTSAQGGPGVFGWDMPRTLAIIRRCRNEGGSVIAIGHCGLEYVPYPPPYIVSAFRAMVDAGADCVIGHHPHVPQGIEWYHGSPIVYSLGNFLFYQHTDLYYRKLGFFITLKFSGTGISGFELHPYRITETGLRKLEAGEEGRFNAKMAAASRPFGTPDGHVKAWDAYLAYYGVQGFSAEVLGILDKIKTEPPKGAAMFRNRITTLQHSELWRDFLTRVMNGEKRTYPKEAYSIVAEWFTKT
jgi:poly-gamma-glutamate capsule biosynthesis protein CapA/YwtB (metallophosphatase superfamily)